MPPFVIFHDSTLRALASLKPRSEAELEVVPGIGAKKLERYGEELLRLMREHGGRWQGKGRYCRQPSYSVVSSSRLSVQSRDRPYGVFAMTTLELKLELPDRLARDAAQMGLLEPDCLQALLHDAVRNRRIAQLAQARQRVADAGIEPMSLEEIQAAVDAYRAEQAETWRGKHVRHCKSPIPEAVRIVEAD